MLKKYEKMDYRVQLMRIVACFMVIGCHVRLEPVINGGLDKELLLLHGFFDDGVAVFFTIMGFFLLSKTVSIWKSTGKTFLHILIPVFLLKICVFVFHDWILQEASFMECLLAFHIDINDLIQNILTLNFSSEDFCGHLWYITSYLRIIVLLPVIKLLTDKTESTKKVCQWIIFINVLSMVVTDLSVLLSSSIPIGTFMIFDVSVTYVVIGYMLYQNKAALESNRRLRYLCLLGMPIIIILRFVLQCYLFQRNANYSYFYFWNTGISLLFTLCFVCFFLTFPVKAPKKPYTIINYIGAKTFAIYLMHMAVYSFLDHRGVRDSFYAVTVWKKANIFTKGAYDFSYPLLVFFCCLILCLLWDTIKFSMIHIRHLFLNK